jgi:hypothetical protein
MAFCINCGKENNESNKFCIGCGKATNETITISNIEKKKLSTEKKSRKNIYLFLGSIGIISISILIYFLNSNKKKEIVGEPQTVAPYDNTINKVANENKPFTNGNPTVLNGEDVYKGYETGKFPVYIKNLYKHNNENYIDIDLVEYYIGEDVKKEMIKDKKNYDESTDEFYIRNNYSTLRTYKISANCRVFNEINEDNSPGVDILKYSNADLNGMLYYIYLKNRTCYKIEEIYMP